MSKTASLFTVRLLPVSLHIIFSKIFKAPGKQAQLPAHFTLMAWDRLLAIRLLTWHKPMLVSKGLF